MPTTYRKNTMTKKPKVSENKAKDVETPKIKKIDLPDAAKAEVTSTLQNLDTYITGVVAGMGIKGKWSFDMRTQQIIVEDK